MKEKLYKIKKYIEDAYDISVEVSPNFLYEHNLLIKSKKYDINISLCETQENHYLYGEYEFVLFYDYEANKKYSNELNCHGGGYSDGYDEKDYSNIDKFLNHWFEIKKEKQLTIFDYV